MTNFNLLRNLVMIYPIASKSRSQSGIIVTNVIDKTSPREGVIVAVGPGAYNGSTGLVDPVDYKFGDHVVYVLANSTEVKNDKEVFHIIPDSEILCKLKEI